MKNQILTRSAARRLLGVLLLLAAPAFGQNALDPSRLPPDTAFFAHWRGTASLDAASANNSVRRLWADPEFAPVRQALLDQFFGGVRKNKDLASWTRQDLEQFVSLLENPFLVGTTGSPAIPGAQAPTAEKATEPAAKHASFLIFDTTGKENLVHKFQEHLREAAAVQPTTTTYDFDSTRIEVVAGPKETFYRATVGPYLVRAESRAAIEDLIARLQSPAPPTSLAQAADFQQALEQIGRGGLLEFFARIPNLAQFPLPMRGSFDTGAFVRGLHLEQLHTLCGSLSLDGPATHLRVALLGDFPASSLFDVSGRSRPEFVTLKLAPAEAISYSAWHVDLAQLYRNLRSVFLASVTPKQRSNLELFEAFIANQIEMKLEDALELFGGEFASIDIGNDLDPSSSLIVATIQKPPEVLRLLHTLLATRIESQEREGDTTYLTLTSVTPGNAPNAFQRRTYYLAVTSQLLLAGPRKQLVRSAVARLSRNPEEQALAQSPGFQRVRTLFPENLASLSYTDLSRIPWQKVLEELQKSQQKHQPQPPGEVREASLLKQASPAVFTRYLHVFAMGSWKNGKGIFIDGYLE